jgi:hypothetical protein
MLMHHPEEVLTGLKRTGFAMPETGIIALKSPRNSENRDISQNRGVQYQSLTHCLFDF